MDDLCVRDFLSPLRNPSLTTVVTVDESGDGEMNVPDR